MKNNIPSNPFDIKLIKLLTTLCDSQEKRIKELEEKVSWKKNLINQIITDDHIQGNVNEILKDECTWHDNAY